MVHVYLKSTCAASEVVTTIFVPPLEAEGLDEEASSIILKKSEGRISGKTSTRTQKWMSSTCVGLTVPFAHKLAPFSTPLSTLSFTSVLLNQAFNSHRSSGEQLGQIGRANV